MWAASEEGVLIRYRDGRFTSFASEHGLPAVNALRLDESADGHLWITSLACVTSFDGERAVSFVAADFQALAAETRIPNQLDVWWSHDQSGLHVLIEGQVKTYAIDADLLGAGVTGVNRDRAGNLWIRTMGAGVVKMGAGGPNATRRGRGCRPMTPWECSSRTGTARSGSAHRTHPGDVEKKISRGSPLKKEAQAHRG